MSRAHCRGYVWIAAAVALYAHGAAPASEREAPSIRIAQDGVVEIIEPQPYFDDFALDEPAFVDPYCDECYYWQVLPDGVLYQSYLAGGREPRISTVVFDEKAQGPLWDSALGGRVGVLRFGTAGPWPDGFQIDVEGAAFLRLDPDNEFDLTSVDFRVGVPLTYRLGMTEAKLAYYHLSSHLGDEFLLRTGTPRDNFSRDAIVLGFAVRPLETLRLYAETAWAFYSDGFSQPWEFQFGADCAPLKQTGIRGAPFAAINTHLREEVDFGGNLIVQLGWAWRGESGRLLRTGIQYFNGKSLQFEFANQFEAQIGYGIWYDY